MIRSMTGFGTAQGSRATGKWAVEIRSWNHRFFDCSVRAPGFLSTLEDEIRDLIHQKVKRGKISVSVMFQSKKTGKNGLILDEEKIYFFVRSLRRIQKQHRLAKEPIGVNALLNIPNLFTVESPAESVEDCQSFLKSLVQQAAERLLVQRAKEGKALGRELLKRVRLLSEALEAIEAAKEGLPREQLARLKERAANLSTSLTFDPARLEQEVALFVDRSDITEEIVRVKHHLRQFEQSLRETAEAGKKLDFIAQEINREVNTIASKSQSSEIASQVVQMKVELDKIREQVQNIE